MMHPLQAHWNRFYEAYMLPFGETPSDFVVEQFATLEGLSRILCLGEGEGRNGIYLADKGLHVDLLDISDVALRRARHRAKAHYTHVGILHTSIQLWEPKALYDGVVCIHLQLPKAEQAVLLEKAIHALLPEGVLIAEFFSESQRHFHSGGPKALDRLYTLGDLKESLKQLPCEILKLSQEVVVLSEGVMHVGKASVIRLMAKRH